MVTDPMTVRVERRSMMPSDPVLLVFGSRCFVGESIFHVFDNLSYAHDTRFSRVIEGGAPGADTMGRHWAVGKDYSVETYPADWERDGKRAGYLRNLRMAEVATHAIGVWDGQSKGTKMMFDILVKAGIPVNLAVLP